MDYRDREIIWQDLRFHPLTKEEVVEQIFTPRAEKLVVGGANLHGMYLALKDPEYRAVLDDPRTMVIVDGMPVVWLLKGFGYDVRREQRTTWVDWLELAFERAARDGRSVFVLGHTDEELRDGIAKARLRWPDLRIGGRSGYFDMSDGSPELRGVLAEISKFAPDFLLLGMGMPRQEHFAARFLDDIDANVIGLGGGAFKYFAGHEATPPRWMGRWGLEWAYRLFRDPKRLAHRYLIEPLLLGAMLAVTRLRGTRGR